MAIYKYSCDSCKKQYFVKHPSDQKIENMDQIRDMMADGDFCDCDSSVSKMLAGFHTSNNEEEVSRHRFENSIQEMKDEVLDSKKYIKRNFEDG